MSVLYLHYFLRCKSPKHCAIPLPRPIRANIDGSLLQITKENRKVVFVCPYCGLVSVYCAQDIVEIPQTDIPSLFQSGECTLVAVEVECDDESCAVPKTVHAIQGASGGTWRPSTIPKNWTFSVAAQCDAGHKLYLDQELAHFFRITSDPF